MAESDWLFYLCCAKITVFLPHSNAGGLFTPFADTGRDDLRLFRLQSISQCFSLETVQAV